MVRALLDAAHAERLAARVGALLGGEAGFDLVEGGGELVPQPDVAAQADALVHLRGGRVVERHVEGAFGHGRSALFAHGERQAALEVLAGGCQAGLDAHGAALDVGVELHVGDVAARAGHELHAAHDAVPVSLRVLRRAVVPLVHGVLQTVVHAERQGVRAGRQVGRQVEAVGRREALVGGHGAAVDVDGRLPVAAFELQADRAPRPAGGHRDLALVPGLATVLVLAAQAVHVADGVLHALGALVGRAGQVDGLGEPGQVELRARRLAEAHRVELEAPQARQVHALRPAGVGQQGEAEAGQSESESFHVSCIY